MNYWFKVKFMTVIFGNEIDDWFRLIF